MFPHLIHLIQMQCMHLEKKMLRLLHLKECEREPEAKAGPAAEQLSKCRASLAEFEATVRDMDPLKFAGAMKTESEFKGGTDSSSTDSWCTRGNKTLF